MPPDVTPDPKSRTLDRPRKKYRRHIASRKQWEKIAAEKVGPCRVCGSVASNGRLYGRIEFHHIVSREDFGDDVAANVAPLCPDCHDCVTRRVPQACRALLLTLRDDEYAYAVTKGGELYFERAYGIEYSRV